MTDEMHTDLVDMDLVRPVAAAVTGHGLPADFKLQAMGVDLPNHKVTCAMKASDGASALVLVDLRTLFYEARATSPVAQDESRLPCLSGKLPYEDEAVTHA